MFCQGTKEPVQNSSGKLAISVRATDILLYIVHQEFRTLYGLSMVNGYSMFFGKL